VSDVRAGLLRDLETNRQSNGYWLNLITYAYRNNEELSDGAKLRALYEGLTPSVLRDAARTYLDTSRYVKVVMTPVPSG
jgi:zinc protease